MTVQINPARYVTIPLAAACTGLTEKAIRQKIHEGVWIEGREYRRAPDGRIYIDLPSVELWVEQGPGSKPARAASASRSRSADSASVAP